MWLLFIGELYICRKTIKNENDQIDQILKKFTPTQKQQYINLLGHILVGQLFKFALALTIWWLF